MADAKLTALTEISVPALEDLTYWVDDPSGAPVSNKLTGARQGGLYGWGTSQVRLTLTSGTPFPVADVTTATQIFATPAVGNLVCIYDGTRPNLYALTTEVVIAIGTKTADTNYDIFLWDNAGSIQGLIGPAWSSATVRGSGAGTTELERFNGVLVNRFAIGGGPGARAGLYIGTFRTISTTGTCAFRGGVTANVGGKWFLWNAYNQRPIILDVIEAATTWTYTTASFRQANAQAGNKCEYVTGDSSVLIDAQAFSVCASSVADQEDNGAAGVGIDSTTVDSALHAAPGRLQAPGSQVALVGASASFAGRPGLGYHSVTWLESGSQGQITTTALTFFGNFGSAQGLNSGLTVRLPG